MRIFFMGTPESAVLSLARLISDGHEIVAVWTQPDKPAGRGKKVHQSPIKEFALKHNLAVHQPTKIKTAEAKALFSSQQSDVAVVVAYGRILPNEFLIAPKHGCINVHFSLLPKYRGAAPVNWAIVNGEQQTGVTTMKIVQELDAGPILLQKATSIGEHETAPELVKRLAELGANLISETLGNLKNIEPKPQPNNEVSFAPLLKREDGLIDWSMNAREIERRVRGFQPWPNAHTEFRARRLTIWRATHEEVEPHSFAPGQIIEARGDRLTLACGAATALRVLELQPEGGRILAVRDFLNGARIRLGEQFGLV